MWRCLLALFLLAAGGLALWPDVARACSCATGNPWERLAQADAAFVGVLIDDPRDNEAAGGSSAFEVTWTFRVDHGVKGDLGNEVQVRSPLHGVSCGFELAVGQRWGILLRRDGDEWAGGLCTQIDPDILLEVAGQPAEPDGQNPAALLVGARHHDARILALDREGRTLSYGYGSGDVLDIAVCPGAERLVEYVRDGGRRGLAIRDLHSFEIVDEIRDGVPFDTLAVSCRDPDAGELLVFAGAFHISNAPDVRILRLHDRSWEEIYAASREPECFSRIVFHPEAEIAYLTGGERCHDLLAVDLLTGEERWLTTFSTNSEQLDLIINLELSPDGARLAALVYESPDRPTTRLLIFDLGADPIAIVETPISDGYDPMDLIWLDESTVLLSGYGGSDGGALLFDTTLAVVGRIPRWYAGRTAVVDGVLYGDADYGVVIAADLPNGRPRTLRTLPNAEVYAFAGLPGGVVIEPAAGADPTPAPTVRTQPVTDVGIDAGPTPTPTFTSPTGPPPSGQEAEAPSTATRLGRWTRVAGASLLGALASVGVYALFQRRRGSKGAAQ